MPSILVVDDDRPAAELYASLVRIFGYEARFATSGREALEHLASELSDLVILDLMMPEMNGIDVVLQIKGDKRTAGVRVVMFTALDETEWRKRAAEAGACDYWIKGGFDFGELQEKIDSCLAISHQSPAKICSSMSSYPGMKKVIAEFVESLPAEIAVMQDLLKLGEMQPLRRIVHKLRGTGGGYGFDAITDLAARVENAINAADPRESIELKINSLSDVMRRIEGFDKCSAA